MRIPRTTVKPRFYVARTERQAFSSWDSLDEALECVARFKREAMSDYARIACIIETNPRGHIHHRIPHESDGVERFVHLDD